MAKDGGGLHPAVKSELFRLVAIFECDVDLGDYEYPCRIELFQSKNTTLFRAHVWEIELCRITPSSPSSPSGKPLHVSDDYLLLERTGRLGRRYESFEAEDQEAALQVVLDDLTVKLKEWTGP